MMDRLNIMPTIINNAKIEIKQKNIDYGDTVNAITGNDNDYLYSRLKRAFKNSISIDIIYLF